MKNILYNSNKKTNAVMSGVLLLTISNLVGKLLGVLFKIPLYDVLKDIGMSYFNTSYNIFITVYVIIATGLPTAISILISNARTEGKIRTIKKIFRISTIIFAILGILGTLFLFIFSDQIGALVGNKNTILSIKYIAPAVFFICICCAFRGYFQGHKVMSATSISEIIEAVGKFVLGFIFAKISINNGNSIEITAAYAIFGVVLGEALSMIFIIIMKICKKCNYDYIDNNEIVVSSKQIIKLLLIISLPIMLESLTLNLTTAIDTFSIVNILTKQIGLENASKLYGDYSTCIITLFRIPSAFFVPIATVIIPYIVEYKTRNDENKLSLILNGIIKLTMVLSLPMTIGMIIFSVPILKLLFSGSNIYYTGPLLVIMSLSIVTSAIYTITTAYLQAYKKQTKPIISALVGVVVKLVLNIVLISIPQIGIAGAPISFFFSYMIMSIINIVFVRKYIGKIKLFNKCLKPIIATTIVSSITALIFILLKYIISDSIAIVITILIFVIIYFFLIILFNTFNKEEILSLPKGEKIYKTLIKMHFIKNDDNVSYLQ